MKKKENKALSLLLNLDIAIASTVLALLILLTVSGVVYRYVLDKPFTWLEEVQLACMVWVVFAAGGAASNSPVTSKRRTCVPGDISRKRLESRSQKLRGRASSVRPLTFGAAVRI